MLENGGECRFNITEIHNPTGLLSHRTLDRNPDLKRVAVETSAFMPLRHIGQPMGGLDTKVFINLHFYFKNPQIGPVY